MVVFSANAVASGDCFDAWRALLARQALEFQVEPVRDQPPCGELRAEAVGDLALTHVVGGVADRYRRRRREIARSQIPFYFVHLQLQGSGFFLNGENEVPIAAGDGMVVDAVHPFEMGFPDRPSVSLVLKVPRQWLAPRVPSPSGVHGTILRRSHPLVPLLTSYLVSGFESAPRLAADAAAMFAQHATELVAQAIRNGPPGAEAASAWREALFVRACRLIALESGDPGLHPDRIARTAGVSTRLLQRIFAERGETIMQRVWDERVRQASRLLRAPEAAHRSITDIAFTCGFRDSAHFTRAFATRTSMTPSQWRKQ